MNVVDYLAGSDLIAADHFEITLPSSSDDVVGANDQVDSFADAFKKKSTKPGVESTQSKKADAKDAHNVLTASLVSGAIGAVLIGGAGWLLMKKDRVASAAIGGVIGAIVGIGAGTAIGIEAAE